WRIHEREHGHGCLRDFGGRTVAVCGWSGRTWIARAGLGRSQGACDGAAAAVAGVSASKALTRRTRAGDRSGRGVPRPLHLRLPTRDVQEDELRRREPLALVDAGWASPHIPFLENRDDDDVVDAGRSKWRAGDPDEGWKHAEPRIVDAGRADARVHADGR